MASEPFLDDEHEDHVNSDARQTSESDGSTQKEIDRRRAEKLKAVRRAVEAGKYDSEEILQRAMQKMLEAVENECSNSSVLHEKPIPSAIQTVKTEQR